VLSLQRFTFWNQLRAARAPHTQSPTEKKRFPNRTAAPRIISINKKKKMLRKKKKETQIKKQKALFLLLLVYKSHHLICFV
jgi:hypothetical protein